MDGEGHGLAAQRGELQAGGAARWERNEGQVQAPVADLRGHLGGAGVADVQLDVGVLVAEGGEQPSDVDRAERIDLKDPERHRAAQPAADLIDGLAGHPGGSERGACFGQQRVAGVGELDAMRRAVKQRACRARVRGCARRLTPPTGRRAAAPTPA